MEELREMLLLALHVCGDAPVHRMVLHTMNALETAEPDGNINLVRKIHTCMSILETAVEENAPERLKKLFGINESAATDFPPDLLSRTDAIRRAYPLVQSAAPRKLYISDLHFYHGNLNREMDVRGFPDTASMNEAMIQAWNAQVNPGDEVYILGDFSMAGGGETNEIARVLNGHLFLITGNHDHRFLDDRSFDASRFGWIRDYAEVRDHGRKVVLSHYPMMCYNGQYRRAGEHPLVYMLYGHVHNTFDEQLVQRYLTSVKGMVHPLTGEAIPFQMINCFCMFCDYKPRTLDEWIEMDRTRREKMETKAAARE